MINSIFRKRLEISLFMCMFGTQISRLLIELFSIPYNITNYVYLISLLLMLSNCNRTTFNKRSLPLLIYQFYILIYAFIEDVPFSQQLIGTSYTWFCVFFIIILNLNEIQTFDYSFFIKLAWNALGMSSLLLLLLASNMFSSFVPYTYLKNGSDRLTMSVIPFSFLTLLLCYKSKRMIERLINILFLLVSLVNIYMSMRKGLLISFIIVLIIAKARKLKFERIKKRKIITFFFGILVIYIFTKIPFFNEKISLFFYKVYISVLGYFGKNNAINNSGAIRYSNITNLFIEMLETYSPLEVLFGKGYAYKNVDFPYLEAFSYFGLFGGLYYLYIALIMPINYILKKGNNEFEIFIQYHSIMCIFQNLYSGLPFGYYKIIPIATLLWSMEKGTKYGKT